LSHNQLLPGSVWPIVTNALVLVFRVTHQACPIGPARLPGYSERNTSEMFQIDNAEYEATWLRRDREQVSQHGRLRGVILSGKASSCITVDIMINRRLELV
jgi:hypothetical protein